MRELRFHIHGEGINAISYSPDGKFLAVGEAGGIASIGLAETGKLVKKLETEEDVTDLSWSPDGN